MLERVNKAGIIPCIQAISLERVNLPINKRPVERPVIKMQVLERDIFEKRTN